MRPFGAARRAGTLFERRGTACGLGQQKIHEEAQERNSRGQRCYSLAWLVVSCARVAGPVSGSVADASHRMIYMGRSKLCFCVVVDLSYSTDDGEEFS